MYVYNPQRMRGCINPAAQSTSKLLTIVASFQSKFVFEATCPYSRKAATLVDSTSHGAMVHSRHPSSISLLVCILCGSLSVHNHYCQVRTAMHVETDFWPIRWDVRVIARLPGIYGNVNCPPTNQYYKISTILCM